MQMYKCEFPGCETQAKIRSTIRQGEYKGLKVCPFHASKYRPQKTSDGTRRTQKRRQETRSEYPEFYKKMGVILQGTRCQECGTILQGSGHEIAHILSKTASKHPEVATNPLNVIGLCIDCHTQFDSSLNNRSKMKCFPLSQVRFELLEPLLENGSSERIFYAQNQKI